MKLRKTLAGLAVAAVASISTASGNELADAFASVSSVNDPVTFQSQVRTGVFLGSGRVRFGRGDSRAANIMSFTPPRFEVGCNGIDWHFGGLSWINGDQIRQMIENAVPAAAMYILELVLGGLCEQCLQGVKNAVDQINKATAMLSNSCELGQNVAKEFLNNAESVRSGICSARRSLDNLADDRLAAHEMCDSNSETGSMFRDMYNNISTALGGGSGSGGSSTVGETEEIQVFACTAFNCTWASLMAMGYIKTRTAAGCTGDPSSSGEGSPAAQCPFDPRNPEHEISYAWGELLQSLIGFESKDPAKGSIFSTATPEQVLEVIMCGNHLPRTVAASTEGLPDAFTVPSDEFASAVAAFECRQTFGVSGAPNEQVGKDLSIIVCSEGATPNLDEYEICADPKKITYDEWFQRGYVQNVFGQGLLYHTLKTLHDVARRFQLGEALTPAEINFVSAAPFPLYKALNLSAVFPDLGALLIMANARPFAYLLAHEYLNRYYRTARLQTSRSKVGEKNLSAVITILYKASQMQNEAVDKEFRWQDRATAWNMKIQSIESAMLRDVYARSLLGNYQFSADLLGYSGP